jgi:hypothetical protein
MPEQVDDGGALPAHTSHSSHGLKQEGIGVQGRQTDGSFKVSSLQPFPCSSVPPSHT